MPKEPKRVKLGPDTDVLRLLEEVRADREPRLLEKDGEEIAVVLSPEDYVILTGEPKSRRNKAKVLALAGAWKDVDTDRMVEEIYSARHESPASPPVEL